MRCESKQPGKGEYWKVKTDAGAWVWADNIILAEPGGAIVGTCEAGGGRFMTDQKGDGLLCPRHNREIFGAPEDHALDAEADRFKRGGNTTKWKRGRRG